MNWGEHFEYRDGELYRRYRADRPANWNSRYAGKRAGTLKSDGYWRVRVDGLRLYEHCIVFEMFYGPIPDGYDVDHINRDKSDNRIENLRLARRAENKINGPVYRNSGSGLRGAQFHKSTGKYQSVITIYGKRRTLGYFGTAKAAHSAYLAAAKKYYGEFAGGGK